MKTLMEFTGQRPGLFDLPPVTVTELTGREFGEGMTRRELALAADAKLREIQRISGLRNDDTGWLLRVNRKGRSKMGDNADLTAAESKSVAGIEALVQNAIAAERHPDIEHNNPDVNAVLRLYAPVTIDGVTYRVKLTVKDYSTAGNPKMLHALAAIEIETPRWGSPRPTPATNRFRRASQPRDAR